MVILCDHCFDGGSLGNGLGVVSVLSFDLRADECAGVVPQHTINHGVHGFDNECNRYLDAPPPDDHPVAQRRRV